MEEKAITLHSALRAAVLPHAFGGGFALGFYGAPRPTADLDLNVFVPPAEWPRVRAALGLDGPAALAGNDARFAWEGIDAHAYLSVDRLHEAMARGVREVALEGTAIPLVAPEHLIARKVVLDREKDWPDVEAMLAATRPLDLAEVEARVEEMVGAGDGRLARLRRLVAG